uniref:Uncharacterized protein n=1 Tax=Cyprinus carpio carpio TaxID=630221 RepID=A0A9J8DJN0_CYPCA
MEASEEAESAAQQQNNAAQRRAEIRRRKLLLNSEQRMKKIVGFSKSDADSARVLEPRLQLDLDGMEACSSKRLSESPGSVSDEAVAEDVRQRLATDERSASPRRGLQKCLSRFDDAMKLRGQLSAEKTAQDGSGEEELDSFCLFRLVCSVALAVFVRIFVCQYLVSAAQTQTQVWDSVHPDSLSCVFAVHLRTVPHSGAGLHGIAQILPKGGEEEPDHDADGRAPVVRDPRRSHQPLHGHVQEDERRLLRPLYLLLHLHHVS